MAAPMFRGFVAAIGRPVGQFLHERSPLWWRPNVRRALYSFAEHFERRVAFT